MEKPVEDGAPSSSSSSTFSRKRKNDDVQPAIEVEENATENFVVEQDRQPGARIIAAKIEKEYVTKEQHINDISCNLFESMMDAITSLIIESNSNPTQTTIQITTSSEEAVKIATGILKKSTEDIIKPMKKSEVTQVAVLELTDKVENVTSTSDQSLTTSMEAIITPTEGNEGEIVATKSAIIPSQASQTAVTLIEEPAADKLVALLWSEGNWTRSKRFHIKGNLPLELFQQIYPKHGENLTECEYNRQQDLKHLFYPQVYSCIGQNSEIILTENLTNNFVEFEILDEDFKIRTENLGCEILLYGSMFAPVLVAVQKGSDVVNDFTPEKIYDVCQVLRDYLLKETEGFSYFAIPYTTKKIALSFTFGVKLDVSPYVKLLGHQLPSDKKQQMQEHWKYKDVKERRTSGHRQATGRKKFHRKY